VRGLGFVGAGWWLVRRLRGNFIVLLSCMIPRSLLSRRIACFPPGASLHPMFPRLICRAEMARDLAPRSLGLQVLCIRINEQEWLRLALCVLLCCPDRNSIRHWQRSPLRCRQLLDHAVFLVSPTTFARTERIQAHPTRIGVGEGDIHLTDSGFWDRNGSEWCSMAWGSTHLMSPPLHSLKPRTTISSP
jgi:hypothetical protein